MQITIRPARPNDLDWMIPELQEFAKFAEHKYSLFPEDENYIRQGFENLILNGVCLCADKENATDGTIEGIGFIVGMYSPHAFNPKIKTLIEMFFWVKEEYRGCRAGLQLFNEYLKIGRETAHWIIFTLEDVSPMKDEFLFKKGFKLKEKNFLMEV